MVRQFEGMENGRCYTPSIFVTSHSKIRSENWDADLTNFETIMCEDVEIVVSANMVPQKAIIKLYFD